VTFGLSIRCQAIFILNFSYHSSVFFSNYISSTIDSRSAHFQVITEIFVKNRNLSENQFGRRMETNMMKEVSLQWALVSKENG
jgi:hypothetical protein